MSKNVNIKITGQVPDYNYDSTTYRLLFIRLQAICIEYGVELETIEEYEE